MNLFSTFLIKCLESLFIAKEPELKELFLNEVAREAQLILDWVNEKMNQKLNQQGENNG